MQLQEVFQKISQDARFKHQIRASKEAFAFKPFVAEYYQFRRLLAGLRYVLGAFSVVTGFGLLYYAFLATMPTVLAAALAGLLLLLIELLKNEASLKAFRQGFSGSFPLLGIPALVLFGLSVILSVNGVQTMYDQLNTRIDDHQQFSARMADSLAASYDAQIEAEKRALAEFRQSVTWRGKIDLYNKTTAAVVRGYEERISALQSEKMASAKNLHESQAEQLHTLRAESDFNRALWLGVSVAVELAIICSLLFFVYYDYRVSREAELITEPQRFSLGVDDLNRLQDFLHLNDPAPVQIAATKQEDEIRTIGFQRPEPATQPRHSVPYSVPHSVPEMPEISRSAEPYSVPHSVPPGLLADIRAGITDYRTLMQRNGVNVNTVKKAFQILQDET